MLDMVDESLAIGDIVAGKYRVEELVGEGAMGRVYRARHLLLGRSVALKVLRASVETEERRTRFVREAKATMGLRSEHVVRVYDLGVLATNTPYMVLEYLEGTDLRTILAERGSLPVPEAVDYVLQACEGLAEAHLAGIVHRDLKPQNLFLTRRANGSSCVKLLDFGVSKFGVKLDSLDELTASHVLLGSPIFMSPEQIRDSRKVDARADLWSLGVVLYMLLGGGRPFAGDGLGATCAAIMVDPPPPLASRLASVPPALEAVVFRCLEKRRGDRMRDVKELAESLAPFASASGRTCVGRIAELFLTGRGGAVSLTLRTTPQALAPREAYEAPLKMTTGERTSLDPTRPVVVGSESVTGVPNAEGARRRTSRQALVGGSALVVVLLGTLGWQLQAPRRAEGGTVRAGSDGDLAGVSPAVAVAPTSGEAQSEPVASGSAPPAAVTLVSPSAVPPRRESARGAKSTASGAKRKGQVDRNGVPILD